MALGEKETAFEFLEQAFEQHEVDIISLKSDPRWKAISDEPRFRELVLRLGLSIG
jgi:adenylate cyclase